MAQDLQAFPRLDSPLVDLETGYLTPPWYRFLISLWQKLGGSQSVTQNFAWLRQSGQTVSAINARTGAVIGSGSLAFSHITGLAQVSVAIGTSPVTLTMNANGTLIVAGGAQVEISRPPGAFIVASLVGGLIPVIINDQVRLTWFGTIKPVVTLFPFATN